MDFGEALKALKEGARVRRRKWAEDSWLCFVRGVVVVTEASERQRKYLPRAMDLSMGTYVMMQSAQGVWSPGWMPLQPDILAEDWEVLEEDS